MEETPWHLLHLQYWRHLIYVVIEHLIKIKKRFKCYSKRRNSSKHYTKETEFTASISKCKKKIKNKKLKSLHVLLWKFTVSKYEYDGNLFAATRKKIIAIFDSNAKCQRKFLKFCISFMVSVSRCWFWCLINVSRFFMFLTSNGQFFIK